ncbi:MAG: hypothetical protein PHT33_02260 [bacterium]|nr:hypothetical protein [bacterium]
MRKGLSLIDLLIVFALCAVLTSVLVRPILVRAGEGDQKAVCMQNLKQLGMAFKMYMQDNDGCIPLASYPPSQNERNCQIVWFRSIARYADNGYVMMHKLPGAFKCPAETRLSAYKPDYGMNYYYGNPNQAVYCIADVKKPAETMLLVESYEPVKPHYAAVSTIKNLTAARDGRHKSGVTALYFDGNAGFRDDAAVIPVDDKDPFWAKPY